MTVEPIGPYAIRQFEIDVLVPLSLFGHDVSFTASSQAMLTTVIVVGGYLTWATRDMKIISGRLQMSAEMRQKFDTQRTPSEQVVKDIRRATRKQYSADVKTRIVPPVSKLPIPSRAIMAYHPTAEIPSYGD